MMTFRDEAMRSSLGRSLLGLFALGLFGWRLRALVGLEGR